MSDVDKVNRNETFLFEAAKTRLLLKIEKYSIAITETRLRKK